MNINISIEARMTSSRLPGKVLMPVNEKPALEIMIYRVKKSKYVNNIIVATTTNQEDDVIVQWCINNNIKYFRGSENNVYKRVLDTHIKNKTDIIVELSGDCPLLDPSIIDKGIEIFLENNYDYVSTGQSYPLGMAVEIFKLTTLKEININRELTYEDKEHVSPYLYTSGKYNTYKFEAEAHNTYNDLSVTLDTKEDYDVINNVCKKFNNFDFSIEDIIKFAKNYPHQVSLNKSIHRKGLS